MTHRGCGITTLSRLRHLSGRWRRHRASIIAHHLRDYARDLVNRDALGGKGLDQYELLLYFGIDGHIGRGGRWRVVRKAACLATCAIQGTQKSGMTGLHLRWKREGERRYVYGLGSRLRGRQEWHV